MQASRRIFLNQLAVAAALTACGKKNAQVFGTISGGQKLPLRYARNLSIQSRNGYHIVDIESAVVSWGGAAGGPRQRVRLALVPRNIQAPPLTGDLAGANMIRTPVSRLAVNEQSHEAMVRALGATDRLVAVGGYNSYDQTIRTKVRAGQIRQIGYGWHQPPTLDALLAARPGVFLSRMADLTHIQHMQRIIALGIPVVPTFIDTEPHYLGRVEWLLLLGILLGREREAQAFVSKVIQEVTRLQQLAKTQPRRTVLWAWYQGSGDRWSVIQRNADAALIRDANAELVLGADDNFELDVFSPLSSEQLLRGATHADCWMIRDPLSSPFSDRDFLNHFKAYRQGCVFWQPGGKLANVDSWELWEMGTIRPDWLLGDVIKMLHPRLRDGKWRYLAPEDWETAHVSTGQH
jgi:iron complex transport system substrate-binding protein